MEEAKQVNATEAREDTNVIHLFDPIRPAKRHEQPATDDELADFRKYWPLMKQMLTEFETLKANGGCPIMRETLGL